MSTNTKRAPGRPKKSPVQSQPKATESVAEQELKYVEPKRKIMGWSFEAKRGGIAFMIPQKNITVFDKERGQVREIRYCTNMSSVYVDEQGDHAKRGSIIFREKMLFVRPDQPQLAEYLRLHPGNSANGGAMFSELDVVGKKETTLADEFAVVDAVAAVRDQPITELLPIAMAYGYQQLSVSS